MVSVFSTGVAPEIAMHPGWLAQAIPEVEDQALRDALFSNIRLAPRIRHIALALVLTEQELANTGSEFSTETTVLAQHWGVPLFRRIGLLWFAPVSAQRLIDAKRHDGDLGVNKAEMRLILQFRTHAAASRVEYVPQDSDYTHHGVQCLVAWLDHFGEQGASLKAALPPQLEKGSVSDLNRAAFVAQLLAEPNVFEGLNDDSH